MLSVEKRKGDLVVRLTGDIDHNAASRLCLALDEAMGKDPDIRRPESVCSSGAISG